MERRLVVNRSGDPGIQSVIFSNQNNLNARLTIVLCEYVSKCHAGDDLNFTIMS